ncbi:unnamed protein product [Aphis gossypii]|uniref:Uncharacterized protein n=1 Tax=Aphis gossypii TaxID=80765 RepID=A0A9P0IL95_APHGO|nr:unnamed protein product [Aphis gossypii]
MSLMYCYAIIIFMVIVNSNSYENYRMIDPKFVNCKNDKQDDYLCYVDPPNGHPNYLNQKLMDPEEFYSALYNPYFYFFHHSNIFDDDVISYPEFVKKRDEYLEKKYARTTPSNFTKLADKQDLKYIGLYPNYWAKRPQFYVVNRRMAMYYYTRKLILMYHSESWKVEGKEREIMSYMTDQDNSI